jgi:mannosyltransferase OCH1-like enzyme
MILDNRDDIDFFEKCNVETSGFNAYLASQDPNWMLARNTYHTDIVTPYTPIPKIIHFIWLGQPLPEWYQENIEDWRVKNSEFEIKVWENDAASAIIKNKQSCEIFSRSDSLGAKSDILRYEILKEFGGLYLDTDFLCLSDEFNVLHDNFSFYTGAAFEQNIRFYNGLIACCPNHPILDLCINNVRDDTYMHISCPQTRVLHQTGPAMFTECALSYFNGAGSRGSIVLPAQTFYPFPAIYREKATRELIQSFIKPWSMACHLWHSSYSPKSKFYAGEMI